MRTSTSSRAQRLTATALLLLGLAACADESAAYGGWPTDVLETPLATAKCQTESDYTPEELEQLAQSPEVQANLEPFRDVPLPDRAQVVGMSDGVRIAVSLYFPTAAAPVQHAWPAVYIETWYTRMGEGQGEAIEMYRKAGFVVAIADPRGFGASFGSQSSYLSDVQRNDQREMIAWLAAQEWSNGQVAAAGISVSAMLAEATLASGAPNLKAGIVRATEFDQYSENLFPGGIPNAPIAGLIEKTYAGNRGEACLADLAACSEIAFMAVDGDDDLQLLRAALRDHANNVPPGSLAGVEFSDDSVGSGSFAEVSPSGHVPELHANAVPARVSSSWLDGTTAQASLERFQALPDVPMQVVIGATTHLGGLSADPFDREAFSVARPDAIEQFQSDVAFLSRTLAGEPVRREVQYYVLGANTWKSTSVWPPRGVQRQTLQLTATELRRHAADEVGAVEYTVDPSASTGPAHNRWASQGNQPVYYGDRRFSSGRTLSFDGAKVHADTELVGAAELCLALRSDQPDGIVLAYLEDVAPDGRVTYLTEAELRLLHRKTASGDCDPAPGTERSFKRADAAPVNPGELMRIELSFLPVAARIQKGHHLRLSLAGADEGTFPTLTAVPAHWSIAFGEAQGSSLILPVKRWSASE